MQGMPSCRLGMGGWEGSPLGPQNPGPPSPVQWLGHLHPSLPNSDLGKSGGCRQFDEKVVLGMLTTTEPTEPAGVPRNYTRILCQAKWRQRDTWPETHPLQLSSNIADGCGWLWSSLIHPLERQQTSNSNDISCQCQFQKKHQGQKFLR